MRRRLATLAAASALALALSASPALANGQAYGLGDLWVVTHASMDITGMAVACGPSTYEVISGAIDIDQRLKGTLAGDYPHQFATSDGAIDQTVTLRNVWVQTSSADKPQRAVGSGRIRASWLDGADFWSRPGDPLFLFTSLSYMEQILVPGTPDGLTVSGNLTGSGTLDFTESENCTDIHLATNW